jgi:hypothetical protein
MKQVVTLLKWFGFQCVLKTKLQIPICMKLNNAKVDEQDFPDLMFNINGKLYFLPRDTYVKTSIQKLPTNIKDYFMDVKIF